MIRNGTILAVFALVCTATIVMLNLYTKDKIIAQEQQQRLGILQQIIPASLHDNPLIEQCTLLENQQALGSASPLPAYIATIKGQPVAIAIETIAPGGYNGEIHLILGISSEGEVLGVRTLSHQETPGLGDKIELKKSNWVDEFTGKFINQHNQQEWAVKKDGGNFDQFTGATITPRAYVQAVRKTLLYFNDNKQTIFNQPLNCGSAHE